VPFFELDISPIIISTQGNNFSYGKTTYWASEACRWLVADIFRASAIYRTYRSRRVLHSFDSTNVRATMVVPSVACFRASNISRFSRQRLTTVLRQISCRYSSSSSQTPQVAVLFQAIDPPVINNVRKPRKPGGKNVEY
jgi:hypothetical protein